ncbi:MAG: hypothetical protein NT023_24585 [Armatimonadetes bacterium]|nr:hypothetical protein [Armatimonadota bacterium]
MQVRFHKGNDGKYTITWVRGNQASEFFRASEFFVFHDLTHYAVETTFGMKNAFYGLMARGWEIDDFGRKDPETGKTRPLPLEAGQAEMIVSLIQLERSGSLSPEDTLVLVREQLAGSMVITEDHLATIRAAYESLAAQWSAVPLDGSLELTFDA